MSKKFLLINFVLIVIVVFLGVKNYDEWTRPVPSEKESTPSKQRTVVPPVVAFAGGQKEPPAPAQFKLISDKNIFSPDRKEFPIPTVTEVKKPPVRPNLQLFGVAIGEEFHSAVINNPTRRPDKNERETITVRQGDKVGEYTVAKVLADRITLESSGDSFDVLLYDPAKQKKRPVVSKTPSPSPVTPPAPVPPRPYTPPGGAPPVPVPPPGGGVSPVPPPGGIPGRNVLRGGTQPRRIPVPPARILRTPVPEEEEDDDDEGDI